MHENEARKLLGLAPKAHHHRGALLRRSLVKRLGKHTAKVRDTCACGATRECVVFDPSRKPIGWNPEVDGDPDVRQFFQRSTRTLSATTWREEQ